MHAALDPWEPATSGGGSPVVVCGTDGRTRHERTVGLAADVAVDLAARVLVLHVRRPTPWAGVDLGVAWPAAVWAVQLQEQSLTSAAEILHQRGVRGEFLATDAGPVPELLRLVRETAARAVVVSGCPRSGYRARLHACPVSVLQRRAACFVLPAD